ncbi:MAG: hypothetical protein AB7E05_15740 [Sphingobium sp.]
MTVEDELPVETIPAIEYWSENFAFYGYDFERRIGFVVYVGRWVRDPSLWREQLYIYLPDGSILSYRTIGPQAEGPDISAGCVKLRCIKPGRHWRIGFKGAMRHDTTSALITEPIPEGAPHLVELNVDVDCTLPVAMMPVTDNMSYGKFHFEQMIDVSGAVKFNGENLPFSGPGYRDHSRGPRHLVDYDGHVWLQLFSPETARFSGYQMWSIQNGQSAQILDKAFGIGSTDFGPAAFNRSVRLSSLANIDDAVHLDLTVGDRRLSLTGKPLANMPSSFTRKFDFYSGASSRADFVCIDQPILFENDDVTIPGYLQRSFRTSAANSISTGEE